MLLRAITSMPKRQTFMTKSRGLNCFIVFVFDILARNKLKQEKEPYNKSNKKIISLPNPARQKTDNRNARESKKVIISLVCVHACVRVVKRVLCEHEYLIIRYVNYFQVVK